MIESIKPDRKVLDTLDLIVSYIYSCSNIGSTHLFLDLWEARILSFPQVMPGADRTFNVNPECYAAIDNLPKVRP